MAQAKEKDQTTAQSREDEPKPGPAPGRPMPDGKGPLEYRRNKKMHLAQAGRVVKQDWIGRVCDRGVRVYYGAQEKNLPDAVRKAVLASNIEIGVITYAELGLPDPAHKAATSFVNLTEAGLDK